MLTNQKGAVLALTGRSGRRDRQRGPERPGDFGEVSGVPCLSFRVIARLRETGTQYSQSIGAFGVWVPACAGTTTSVLRAYPHPI